MIRKIILSIFVVLVVLGALAGTKVLQIRRLIASAKSMPLPPETVSSVTAREEKWPRTLSAVGTITAVQGVTITPELPGTVQEIAFDSGAVVAKGALLVRLDTSSEEAQLAAVQAQLDLARINLDRNRRLRAENTISQSELDAAEAGTKQYQANADTIRATISKKIIRAPFAGRLGIRQINLGQYLEPGKSIVSLQSLAPVYAEFSLPQQDLARLKTGMKARLSTDTYPGRQFEGALTAMNPDLDRATRMVSLQATLPNSDQSLRPGMFARIEVILPEEQTELIVPATSILSAPFGDSVYVVESSSSSNGAAGLVVRQQFVKTGRTRGDFVSVESGLKGGERVVSSGLFKLRNGMSVVENNKLAPPSSATPRPTDS